MGPAQMVRTANAMPNAVRRMAAVQPCLCHQPDFSDSIGLRLSEPAARETKGRYK